jgi:hypothetical protein
MRIAELSSAGTFECRTTLAGFTVTQPKVKQVDRLERTTGSQLLVASAADDRLRFAAPDQPAAGDGRETQCVAQHDYCRQ